MYHASSSKHSMCKSVLLGFTLSILCDFQKLNEQVSILVAARDEALNSTKLLKQKLKEAKGSPDAAKKLQELEITNEEVKKPLFCLLKHAKTHNYCF